MRRDEFEQVVDEVLDHLPDWALERIDNLRVVVEEWPTAEQDPDDQGLLGLYDGIALPERGLDYVDVMPDTIWIFRQPHLELGLVGEGLREEIRRTVLHELAHYFGLDDDYLDEIGWG
ncbi:metallopeptidase family protein [Thioalkalivibrio sp. XN8]|uniref:metallopeptidase family protein n=1 Tax=Thioalkalivibrio sp. XN8 TaxID=2712863 RepID=UPI0013ECAA9B|nr:metallopeptidase family protein [Thioalkalivibrio sp. XN8]NGP52102.1 metallopeptidase family protein [Thioalkalivibrio sp. XN8]